MPLFLADKVAFQVALEEIIQKMLSVYFKVVVCTRSQIKLKPH